MKDPSGVPTFLGYRKGDRVLLKKWRLLKGGMTGTVRRVFGGGMIVHLDCGPLETLRSQEQAERMGMRRLAPEEDAAR